MKTEDKEKNITVSSQGRKKPKAERSGEAAAQDEEEPVRSSRIKHTKRPEQPAGKSSTAKKKKKKKPTGERPASPDRRSSTAAPKKEKQKAFDGGAAFKSSAKKKPEKKKDEDEPLLHARTEKPLMPIWFKRSDKPLLPILSGRNKNKKVKRSAGKKSTKGDSVTPIWTGSDDREQQAFETAVQAEPETRKPKDEALERAVESLAESEAEENRARKPELRPVEPPEEQEEKKLSRRERKALKKAEAAETVDMNTFEKQRARKRSFRRLRRLLIVLVIAAGAASLYYTRGKWVPKLEGILDKPQATIVNDGRVQAGNFPIDLGDSTTASLATLDDDLICVDVGMVTTYDSNGKVRTTDFNSYGSPIARTAGKRMLIFDSNSTSFRLLNKNGEVYEKRTENIIIYGAVAENGNALIVTLDDKYTTLLTVYDRNGAQIYVWGCGERITDASFAEDGDACVVSTFDVSGGQMVSRIHRIDLTKSDSILESRRLDGCVIRVQENKDGRIWAATIDRMYLLTDVCSYIGEYDFEEELVSLDMCEDCACAAFKSSTHDKTTVFLFSSEDSEARPGRIVGGTGRIRRVRCFESMAFVLSSDKLDCFSPDGSLAATSQLIDDYSDFCYVDDAVYLLGKREINKVIYNTGG